MATPATQFYEFLKMPIHDASDVNEAKAAICDALVGLFPKSACVAIIDIQDLEPAVRAVVKHVVGSLGAKREAERASLD